MPASVQHLRSGRLIGLGVSSATRDPVLPDVPSIAESGVAGYEFYDWQGVVAPSKTPAVAITRLNQEFVKTLGRRSLHPAPQGTIFRISIVPPETDEILNLDAGKAQEVFNLHRAVREPRDRPLYIVEGFFDCIWLWQHGIRRVVALMGSSLSQVQAALIQRAANPDDRIVVMLDEDDAGRAGREKILSRLAEHCFVRIHRFAQEDQQPDSLTVEQLQGLGAI